MTRRKCRNLLGRFHSRPRTSDPLTLAERSARMAKIRGKKTAFESRFIEALSTRCKIRFESHCSDIYGKPDLVFRKQRVCVFLDSDFWHGWQFPRWTHKMKNEFWRKKIMHNRMRDRRVNRALRSSGWHVIRIWEHNIKRDIAHEIRHVLSVINSPLSCGGTNAPSLARISTSITKTKERPTGGIENKTLP